MYRVRRIYRTPVGAAISRPKSFDFADVFYKSYRIIVPIIRGRLIAAPTLVGTKGRDKLRFRFQISVCGAVCPDGITKIYQ